MRVSWLFNRKKIYDRKPFAWNINNPCFRQYYYYYSSHVSCYMLSCTILLVIWKREWLVKWKKHEQVCTSSSKLNSYLKPEHSYGAIAQKPKPQKPGHAYFGSPAEYMKNLGYLLYVFMPLW